jgi:hypothetical protein
MGDWDRETIKAPSVYLKLTTKGDKVRVRIADKPYRELQLWPRERGGKPVPKDELARFTVGQWKRAFTSADWNPSEIFHLVVIDRADGAAKILTVFASTYTKIQEYANNPEWGNPTNYDITVERTEEPGKNYFSVMALPNKTMLTDGELAKVTELDTSKLIQGARPAADPQPDDFTDDTVTELLPWEQSVTANEPVTQPRPAPAPGQNYHQDPFPPHVQPDPIIEDIGDDPINLNDIPF